MPFRKQKRIAIRAANALQITRIIDVSANAIFFTYTPNKFASHLYLVDHSITTRNDFKNLRTT